MEMILLKGNYAIYKYPPTFPIPEWLSTSPFYSITKTDEELSVVARQAATDPGTTNSNSSWRLLKVAGPLYFSLVGIIAGISAILSDAGISIFTISTYDTDYILVKETDIEKAVEALRRGGWGVKVE